MFMLVTIDPDTVDIYETTGNIARNLTDLHTNGIICEHFAVDEQASPWCNDLPQFSREKWAQFVQIVTLEKSVPS